MDQPTIVTLALAALSGVGTGAGLLWKWIIKQLEECKGEHRQSRERIEELHEEIKEVSSSVGELRGQLIFYRNHNNDVDTGPKHP